MGGASLALLTWLALRARLQEPLVLHENVGQFPLQVLEAFLGKWYVIMPLLTTPDALGHPVVRQRRITLLVHRQVVAIAAGATPWADMLLLCGKPVK
eukprot:3185885-Alexandrium_andersonii.AAC.1